ncbi:hypothetical protein [Streptomyces sp. CB03238]|uniref:hypothetical protein n=1 Tax=Streptomyces sp. CB03238 TaxID=1907777 RepID=UPI000A0FD997|nr:hypothetical protein [Streptomyces sp. CB03238]ORT57569.1 hypothetical protein BKD26_23320 [Streptomyces sp. CB03238]
MRRPTARSALAALAALALVVAAIAVQLGVSRPATAAAGQTTAVNGGPETFTQALPTGGASQYTTPLERCHTSPSYPLSGRNPILDEPLTRSFTSNVPLSVSVRADSTTGYGLRELVFTNRSSKPVHLDCGVLVFLAPSGSDQHHYGASQPFGHPQQDFVEVKRGDGTSYYIARLGFHDVALPQRGIDPGHTWVYKLGGPNQGAVSLETTRDSVRFTADLTVSSNTDLVKKYGTTRYAN